MAENTAISWTDHTFNPWIGCTKVGPGCDNCYAKADFEDRKRRVIWGAGQARSRTAPANWKKPLQWNKDPFYECRSCGWRGAEKQSLPCDCGRDYPHRRCPNCNTTETLSPARRRVFCASLADVFDNEVPYEWRLDLFALIVATPNLDWLLLTKRIGNVGSMVEPIMWKHLPNVWLGATIVNQEEADRDIPKLLATPARVRFLSMEPLLGPVDLTVLPSGKRWEIDALNGEWAVEHDGGVDGESWTERIDGGPKLDWVIVGGESGPKARPSHPDWFRSLRDQCAAAGVPFLFKQWGAWVPHFDRDKDDLDWRADYTLTERQPEQCRILNAAGGYGFSGERVHMMKRVGKKAAGRLLDGVEHNGFPGVGNA